MSTALIRDIRDALADFGRPVPEDVTLTTGVRELIAAVSESEQDLERVRADRDDCVTRGAAIAIDLATANRERDKALADVADLRATVDGLVTERATLIATANQRLYSAKGVAFFSGVAVATIVGALLRMAQ